MKPRISVLTLGVADLEKSVRFYRDGLGLRTEGIVGREFDCGAVAFFPLGDHLNLALWEKKSIAHDTGLPASPNSPTSFTIGHNVRSQSEVDEVMAQATKAGGKVLKEACATFWGGYSGYFQDPDGHIWEVVWNPQLMPDD